jgi:glycosylphosphatidylinositol transamidase (GPIT) subunit GPI8
MITVKITITLNEEEMELYSEMYNKVTMQKKPSEIIRNIKPYDCLNHQVKEIMRAINIVLKEMSVLSFVVLSQNTERALILSIMEDIK